MQQLKNAYLQALTRQRRLISCRSRSPLAGRVFRFGSSWSPAIQHSPCSPSFGENIPYGAHIMGLWGRRAPTGTAANGGGALTSVGVYYCQNSEVAAAIPRPPRPYQVRAGRSPPVRSLKPRLSHTALTTITPTTLQAEYDAVSLAFPRSFYDRHVKPLDSTPGAAPATTDWVARNVVMRETWAPATCRAQRFAELLEPRDKWRSRVCAREMRLALKTHLRWKFFPPARSFRQPVLVGA